MSFSNVATRVIVAVITIPIILLLSYLGGIFFLLFVATIISLSLFEFYKLTELRSASPNYFLGVLFSLILLLLFYLKRNDLIPFSIFLFIALTSLVELFKKENNSILNLNSTVFGAVILGFFYSTIIGLREFFGTYGNEDYVKGGLLVITIFVAIWICDSAAYFGGTALGNHRLLERISPKKSWEGAIFGFIFAILAAIAAKILFLDFVTWFDIFFIGVVVGVIGQMGDLVESMIKRNAGVKDSSTLIPGHGGVFDRFDSLLFVAPFVYYYFVIVYG